jgi:serine O-acetyltransferase
LDNGVDFIFRGAPHLAVAYSGANYGSTPAGARKEIKGIIKMKDKDSKLWEEIKKSAQTLLDRESVLSKFLKTAIINQDSMESSFSYILSEKLDTKYVSKLSIRKLFYSVLEKSIAIKDAIKLDLSAVIERDPAVTEAIYPFLYFKGFHALESYRIANWLWKDNRKALAYYLQNVISEKFSIDIHPAAEIGNGIFVDHGTSIVIGETAIIENNVSLLHEVTLGGTGKSVGKRHPHVESGVMIGAGAKILGNIRIGKNAKIGSGSVILTDIPAHTTAVGVPGKIVGHPKESTPALQMNQKI